AVVAEFNHHLHAESPLAGLMAGRHPNVYVCVEFSADCSHWTVANDSERGVQIHAGSEPWLGTSLQIGALIGEAHSGNGVTCDQRLSDGHTRPNLHQTGRGDLIADPLIELAERQHEAIVFAHERWRV